MKKNPLKTFFSIIGNAVKNFFMALSFWTLYIFGKPFVRCKVIGKKTVSKNDEARVFVANHYEIYGPITIFLHFPFKFRPWIIDKMASPESIEEQMSLGVYSKFEKYPMWLKKLAVKTLKNFVLYTLTKRAKGIPVSRDNPRANIKTMHDSMETLNKGKNIVIFPEEHYVQEGVGEFQTGFEHLAKYYYQKTGKRISFYPIFISQNNKKMYIEKPIIYNPENDHNDEKKRITTYLHDEMVNLYLKHEINNQTKKDVK